MTHKNFKDFLNEGNNAAEMYKNEILPEDELNFEQEPKELNGVVDYYNSNQMSGPMEVIEQNGDEAVTMLLGDEHGNIKASIEDGLNQLEDYGDYSREELELFAKYVRSYGI